MTHPSSLGALDGAPHLPISSSDESQWSRLRQRPSRFTSRLPIVSSNPTGSRSTKTSPHAPLPHFPPRAGSISPPPCGSFPSRTAATRPIRRAWSGRTTVTQNLRGGRIDEKSVTQVVRAGRTISTPVARPDRRAPTGRVAVTRVVRYGQTTSVAVTRPDQARQMG
jgi:hypothetical protein